MNRGRIHVGVTVPETGSSRVQANVIVVWDPDAALADQEHAIKEAAKAAITRVRQVASGIVRPCSVSS